MRKNQFPAASFSFFHFLALAAVDLLWVKQLTVLVGEDWRRNAPDREDMKHRKAV